MSSRSTQPLPTTPPRLNTSACTLAYWHNPRFSSGEHGNDVSMDAIWDLLYQQGVDVVINGHDHAYERFAPIDDTDSHNDEHGIHSFVVGTGGNSHDPLVALQPNSEAWNGDTFGVLMLTLHDSSYDWEFVPEAGQQLSLSANPQRILQLTAHFPAATVAA